MINDEGTGGNNLRVIDLSLADFEALGVPRSMGVQRINIGGGGGSSSNSSGGGGGGGGGGRFRAHIKGGEWGRWVNIGSSDVAGEYGHEIDGIQVEGRSYQAHAAGQWWPVVNRCDNTDDGYAGVWGNAIDGIRVYNARYQAHLRNGDWLPEVDRCDNSDDGYAGIYGRSIDVFKIRNK
jgi:hypothetical protein